jgi:hypothetical protein
MVRLTRRTTAMGIRLRPPGLGVVIWTTIVPEGNRSNGTGILPFLTQLIAVPDPARQAEPHDQ